MKSILLIIISFCFYKNILLSQDIIVPHLDGAIEFDGSPSESVWQQAKTFETISYQPYNGNPPKDKDRFRLFFDDKYIYVGIEIWEEKIIYSTKKRDDFTLNTDWAGIIIDSYNDRENAQAFTTTPTGLRSDYTIFNDARGKFPLNISWNGFWDIKVKKYKDRWTAEMRIPLSTLKFQIKDGLTKMGVILWRYNASHNEFSTYPYIDDDNGQWSSLRPSLSKTMTFPSLKSSNPVYVSPYILAGYDDPPLIDGGQKSHLTGGLDVKYNITNNLTLDASLNTDFAQVEVDDEQINLTRFSLFFPEKRQFFQERASLFTVRMGGPNRVYYSRKIGLKDGKVQDILGGLRLTGKIGSYDVGLINMTTREGLHPDEVFSVARIRRSVINSGSYAGLIVTNKFDGKGHYNTVYSLDGIFRWGKEVLQLKWAQSYEDNFKNRVFSLDAGRFFINLERNAGEGFTYDVSLAHSGKSYNPEMGFELRRNYLASFLIFGYAWRGADDSQIYTKKLSSRNYFFYKPGKGEFETKVIGLNYSVDYKSGYKIGGGVTHKIENLFEAFSLPGEVIIPEGTYPFTNFEFSADTPGNKNIRFKINLEGGSYFTGKKYSLGTKLDWNVTPNIILSTSYNYDVLDFEKLSKLHLLRFKVDYSITTQWSFSSFVQFNSEKDIVSSNIRLRYNPTEGTDLYVVYNGLQDAERLSPDEEIAFSGVTIKFTKTFIF